MTTKKKKDVEFEIYERQVQICKAFAHPMRLKMLDLISEREIGVTEIQQELGITKANVSQHLSILKAAGVLTTRRDGKQVLCSLAFPEVRQACHLIRKVLQSQLTASRRLME